MLDEWVGLGYNTRCQCDGLSPNGKATDSDSVIVKVRILLAQLKKLRRDISSELFAILHEMSKVILDQILKYRSNSAGWGILLISRHSARFMATQL